MKSAVFLLGRASLLCICASTFFGSFALAQTNTPAKATLILVQGAPGEEEFGNQFAKWSEKWEQSAKAAGARLIKVGFGETNSTSYAVTIRQRPSGHKLFSYEKKRGGSFPWSRLTVQQILVRSPGTVIQTRVPP